MPLERAGLGSVFWGDPKRGWIGLWKKSPTISHLPTKEMAHGMMSRTNSRAAQSHCNRTAQLHTERHACAHHISVTRFTWSSSPAMVVHVSRGV